MNNRINSFSSKIIEEIGYYVYALVNPKNKNIFYIGKGSGNRCFQHLKNNPKGNIKISKTLRGLKDENFIPSIDILRYGLSEAGALDVEAGIIDSIGLQNLTNEVRGHNIEKGRIKADDLNRLLGGKTLNIEEIKDNIILFFPHKALEKGHETYDSTRQFWAISESRMKNKPDSEDLFYKYAFGMQGNFVLDVYEIIKWFPAGTTISSRPFNDDQKTRWEFIGKNIPLATEKLYKNKRLLENKQSLKASQRGFRYLNCGKSMK